MDRGDWSRIVLVLHVLGAILGLGTNLTYGLIAAVGERAGGAGRTYGLRLIHQLDRRLANPAYMAQLVTGLVLVWLLELNLLETSWLLVALGLYALVAVVGITVYGPVARRQVALAELLEGIGADAGALASEYAAVARRSNVLGIAVTVVVVLIVVLMVVKPSLW